MAISEKLVNSLLTATAGWDGRPTPLILRAFLARNLSSSMPIFTKASSREFITRSMLIEVNYSSFSKSEMNFGCSAKGIR